MDVLDGEI